MKDFVKQWFIRFGKMNIGKYSFLLIILFMVLIIYFPTVNSVMDLKSNLSVELSPDTKYILSVLEWNLYSIENDINALYHLNYFYPNAYVTFYGHPLFGETLVFYALNKILGTDLLKSYGLFILFGLWIGGIGIFILAKEILNSTSQAYFSSFLFIVYPSIKRAAEILNIFSFFWIGFVLYFLIKFWKSREFKHGFLCGFFIFLQGLFSIYHGYFLIALLIPIFFLVMLLLKTISLKSIFKFFMSILPFLLLLIIVFHPFLNTMNDAGLKRNLHYQSLVDSRLLFTSEAMTYRHIDCNTHPIKRFFPGFAVLILFLIAIFFNGIKRSFLIFPIIIQLITVYFLNLNSLYIWANLLLVILSIQIFIYFIINKHLFNKEMRLLLTVFFIYNAVFFKFSSIIPGAKFSIYGLLVKLVPSFSNFRYLYRGLFLIFPILILVSSIGFFKLFTYVKSKKRYILLIIPLIILMENWNYVSYKKEIKFEIKKYRKIEKRKDKIILEVPIFIPGYMQLKNGDYTINTFAHYNYYVNGRTAYNVFYENNEIFKRVFLNKYFPDEENIKYLIENFSVNYIIFNLNRRLRYSKKDIIRRVNELKNYCKLVDSGKFFLIVKLSENFPKKLFKRRFSLFHIEKRKIKIRLRNLYSGNVKISFPKKQKAKMIRIDNKSEFYINFPEINPNLNGNNVLLEFNRKVNLLSFDLVEL